MKQLQSHKCEKSHFAFLLQGSHFFVFWIQQVWQIFVLQYMVYVMTQNMESRKNMVQVLPIVGPMWKAEWDPCCHCRPPAWVLPVGPFVHSRAAQLVTVTVVKASIGERRHCGDIERVVTWPLFVHWQGRIRTRVSRVSSHEDTSAAQFPFKFLLGEHRSRDHPIELTLATITRCQAQVRWFESSHLTLASLFSPSEGPLRGHTPLLQKEDRNGSQARPSDGRISEWTGPGLDPSACFGVSLFRQEIVGCKGRHGLVRERVLHLR